MHNGVGEKEVIIVIDGRVQISRRQSEIWQALGDAGENKKNLRHDAGGVKLNGFSAAGFCVV